MNQPAPSDLLDRSEWCFEGDVSYACVYFEYCREIKALPEMLAIWRSHFPSQLLPTWDQLKHVFDPRNETPETAVIAKIYDSPMRIALICPDFPRRPWLEIPEILREDGKQEIQWHEIERELRSRQPGMVDFSGIGYEFQISGWCSPDKVLMQEFKEWLEKNRPFAPARKPVGRKASPGDLLEALSVYRLSRHARKVRASQYEIRERNAPPSPSQISVLQKKVRLFLEKLSAPDPDRYEKLKSNFSK